MTVVMSAPAPARCPPLTCLRPPAVRWPVAPTGAVRPAPARAARSGQYPASRRSPAPRDAAGQRGARKVARPDPDGAYSAEPLSPDQPERRPSAVTAAPTGSSCLAVVGAGCGDACRFTCAGPRDRAGAAARRSTNHLIHEALPCGDFIPVGPRTTWPLGAGGGRWRRSPRGDGSRRPHVQLPAPGPVATPEVRALSSSSRGRRTSAGCTSGCPRAARPARSRPRCDRRPCAGRPPSCRGCGCRSAQRQPGSAAPR